MPCMTLEEFTQLPAMEHQIPELHRGILVFKKRPNKRQDGRIFRVRRALQAWADLEGVLLLHLPFCPLPENEVRVADLAFVPQARWDSAATSAYFPGAPDWVIEVLWNAHTPDSIEEKTQLCLANGCREFWLVDNENQSVKVITAAGTKTYRRNEHIPLLVLNGYLLPAANLFAQH